MARFPTDPWFQEFIAAINASERYREVAATWEGDVAFQIEAEPDKGVPATVVEPERGAASTYVISAPYSRWREVLEGDLDPIRGMMQGKLRVQGDLPTIIRYVSAANELVHLTGTVDTEFPDGD